MLILTFRPLTSILCTYKYDHSESPNNPTMEYTHPKIDTDRRARLVLGYPLLIREA